MAEHKQNFGVRPAMEDIAIEFGRLGLTSFGGPVAHIAFFREAFVVRRGWLSEKAFADLVALCQFLPGPASSQAAFALGMIRGGWLGAVVASVLFLWPSAACMIALADYASSSPDFAASAWVHGLKVATVGIVLHAVWSMSRALCPDMARGAIATLAAVACLLLPGAITNVAAIGLGLVIGRVILSRRADLAGSGEASGARPGSGTGAVDDAMLGDATRAPTSRRTGAALLVACAALLAVSFGIGAAGRGNDNVEQAAAMYRSGSLVFGGGHVVLPLLREQTVARGWIGDDAFLTGYAGAQAVPGPLFSFAGYLGAAMKPADGVDAAGALPRWLNGVVCLIAIFLPGWLLVAGAMPFWHRLRAMPGAVGALRGANAAVVGVLFAAWIDPVATSTIRQAWGPGLVDIGVAAAAFVALAWLRVPAWAVVLACAVGMWAGMWGVSQF